MLGPKQPVLGIAAAILVMVASLAFISLFEFPIFASWVAFLMICLIPMQIVVGVTWGANQPAFAAGQKQPLKGMLLTALTIVAGAIVAPAYLSLAGGNITPPGPPPTIQQVVC